MGRVIEIRHPKTNAARGAITPVAILRRKPEGRRIRLTMKERYPCRLSKGRKAKSPGELVQIDTLFGMLPVIHDLLTGDLLLDHTARAQQIT